MVVACVQLDILYINTGLFIIHNVLGNLLVAEAKGLLKNRGDISLNVKSR